MKKKLKKIPRNTFAFEIVEHEGELKAVLKSSPYYKHFLKTHCKAGDKGTMVMDMHKRTRSHNQLAYYAVIVGLYADYSGYSWDDVHDWFMKTKWGVKMVTIDGKTTESRQSVSDAAMFPMDLMGETIEYALEICARFDVHVPTKAELGYDDDSHY